jgi:hypothetical protein
MGRCHHQIVLFDNFTADVVVAVDDVAVVSIDVDLKLLLHK